jgi:hypothetical protein
MAANRRLADLFPGCGMSMGDRRRSRTWVSLSRRVNSRAWRRREGLSRPCGTDLAGDLYAALAPDFLHAALDMSAFAAFFTESRMRLIDSSEPNRKSGCVLGYFQPSLRDWYRHTPRAVLFSAGAVEMSRSKKRRAAVGRAALSACKAARDKRC